MAPTSSNPVRLIAGWSGSKEAISSTAIWDDATVPRQESWREDILTAQRSGREKLEMYKHLRAAAESGIDFSSRWFADGKNLVTIRTTEFIPPDLNALLYHLEWAISKAKLMNKEDSSAADFRRKAMHRGELIDKYCWNKSVNFYTDYNFKTAKQSTHITPGGMYPFCFINERPRLYELPRQESGGCHPRQTAPARRDRNNEFNTGEQWDGAKRLAPLEWMTIWGLDPLRTKRFGSGHRGPLGEARRKGI